MNQEANTGRGGRWLTALAGDARPLTGLPSSVRAVDSRLNGLPIRYVAVVPDAGNPFPRARSGEVGLLEGWTLARVVREARVTDEGAARKRAIVAVIDVPSQAYGRTEEAFGIHQALAAAVEAYAQARQAGHPVLGLIVGKAMSGAFLAHGYQANRLLALDDPDIQVQAMGKQAAARITQRSVEGVEALAETITPMAYDIASLDSLGLLFRRMKVEDADAPSDRDVAGVQAALAEAIEDIGGGRDLSSRLDASGRPASVEVRRRLRLQWPSR